MISNQYIFTRIMTTKFYHYFVISQIILTITLIFMVFKSFQKSYIIQLTLTSMMILDMLIRYLGDTNGNYWTYILNKVDVGILATLLLLFGFETIFKRNVQIQELQTGIIVLRVCSMLYRIARLIKQEKDSREVQNLQPLDLSFDQENFIDKIH